MEVESCRQVKSVEYKKYHLCDHYIVLSNAQKYML